MAYQTSFPRTAVLCAVIAVILHGGIRPLAAQGVGQQVELSVVLLELSVAEWGERNAVPSTDGANARSVALAAVEKKFKTERASLYQSYFTNAPEHLAFFAKHAAEVDEYLADHPDIKGRIDALSKTLRSLITSDESKGSANTGASQ